LQPRGEIDLRVATFSLFGMMNWLYNWYRPGRDVDVNRLAGDINRLFLGGFLQGGADLPRAAEQAVPGEQRPSFWHS
jgi:hypothetical protein